MTEERSCRAHNIFLRFAPIVSGVFSDGIEDVLLCAAHRTAIILKGRKQRLHEFLVLFYRDVRYPERVVIIAVSEDDAFNFRVLAHCVSLLSVPNIYLVYTFAASAPTAIIPVTNRSMQVNIIPNESIRYEICSTILSRRILSVSALISFSVSSICV